MHDSGEGFDRKHKDVYYSQLFIIVKLNDKKAAKFLEMYELKVPWPVPDLKQKTNYKKHHRYQHRDAIDKINMMMYIRIRSTLIRIIIDTAISQEIEKN